MASTLSSSLPGTESSFLSSTDGYGVLSDTATSGDFRFDASDGSAALGELPDPRRDPLYVVVPVTIIYATIFISGTVGNISTCIVIARNKSMHTATNYYLFSLAVSDLLLLVSGMPAEIYMVWCKYPYIFGEGFCILRGLAAETSTNASVLTIAAFTVERYVAICHPFLSQTMSKLSRAIKLILAIWIVALSFALPQALQFGVVRYSEANPEMVMCLVKRVIIQHSFELSTFLFFVVPMCMITVLYALIGVKLRKSNMMKKSVGRSESSRSCRHHPGRSSRRVLKMLVAVVVAFFICWAPFHVQRLIAIYGASMKDSVGGRRNWMEFLYLLMTYISGVLYYVSTTINPILYNIMSNKFRAAFMETLSRSCKLPGLGIPAEQRSYSSLSRSQPRTANGLVGGGGRKGSRTMGGTVGTGVPADSTDTSGNSPRDETVAKSTSPEESRENNEKSFDSSTENRLGSRRNGYLRPDETGNVGTTPLWTKLVNVHGARTEPKLRQPRKKCWRLIKRLPNFKFFRSRGGNGRAIAENGENRREEYSMAVCNVQECNEQRPV